MKPVFLTGASGNVGSAVLQYLAHNGTRTIAGVRAPGRYTNHHKNTRFVHFDFDDPQTFAPALKGVEKVFLVRPPHITSMERVFHPFIDTCASEGVTHLVFLSLLGAEKNPFPPHHKIEKAILRSGIDYTFVRPGFFMQNLSTTHAADIRDRDDLFIPAGKAKISFVDTEDVGEIIGKVLVDEGHRNRAYTVTGPEAITCGHAAQVLSDVLGRKITYSNPRALTFRKTMIRRGTPKEFANVMTVLYGTTKLGMAAQVTPDAQHILGRSPRTFRDFALAHQNVWRPKI